MAQDGPKLGPPMGPRWAQAPHGLSAPEPPRIGAIDVKFGPDVHSDTDVESDFAFVFNSEFRFDSYFGVDFESELNWDSKFVLDSAFDSDGHRQKYKWCAVDYKATATRS